MMGSKRQFLALVTAALVTAQACWSIDAFASRPPLERSAEACERLLNGAPVQSNAPSAATLIPMTLVLKAAKAGYLAKLWRWAVPGSKRYPTQGLTQMYRTAETAADALIEEMNIEAVRPLFNSRNPYQAAAATLKLIRSKNPPEYIRKAVLIRDNIVIVVPILKRVMLKNPKTGLPMYEPIITKGHQELQSNDVLSAAFAGWALEFWQKALPENAYVYLQPMAEKRGRTARDKKSTEYKIEVEKYMPQIHELAENFFREAEVAANADRDAVEKSKPERRNGALEKSPWWEFAKTKLADAKDVSMMPNPPREEPTELLTALGYGDLERLSKLDINSDEFVEVAMRAGISPDRLTYYIAHALATSRNTILVTKPFEDPIAEKVAGATEIVHIDFEDLMSRRLLSGVYLFGAEIQGVSGSKPVEKKFIFAEALEPAAVEKVWAEFLLFLKTSPRLKSRKYVITTYSKHEIVKVEQEFNILKQAPEKFTPAERRSRFYSEAAVGAKTIGRLIRRQDFFKRYPKLTPGDVFDMIDRSVDLLDFVRKNFAFPGYTNSIKQVLKYLGYDLYGPGHNGLESIAWAKEAYSTGEDSLFEKIRDYNEKDIDGNRFVSDFLRLRAGQPVTESLRPRPQFSALKKQLAESVTLKRKVMALQDKSRLLQVIMGRGVAELSTKQLKKLTDILDRTDYLEEREKTQDNEKLDDDEVNEELQRKKFELDEKRTEELYEFFGKLNPKSVSEENTDASQALAWLLSEGNQYLTPTHVRQIALLEMLEGLMAKVGWKPAKNLRDRLELPKPLADALLKIETNLGGSGDVSMAEIEKLWRGLYFAEAFPSVKEPPNDKQ